MNRKLKRYLTVFAVLVTVFALARVYYRVTDDFRLANMIHEIPYNPNWDVSSLHDLEEPQIDSILSQEFTYIGKGAQSYAFESADHQYVLKFFKFKHLKPSKFVDMLPNVPPFVGYKESISIRKHRKLIGVFDGYRLSYDVHKPESGLVYMQLNIKDNPPRSVKVRDKIGLQRTIDLQSVVFVLQKKGKTLRTVMNELLSSGDIGTAKIRIGQIFDLYASEYRKGIYDRDHGVMHNTGFIADQAFHLDLGKMSREEAMREFQPAHDDLQLIVNKITLWVHNNYPQYDEEIKEFIDERVAALF